MVLNTRSTAKLLTDKKVCSRCIVTRAGELEESRNSYKWGAFTRHLGV